MKEIVERIDVTNASMYTLEELSRVYQRIRSVE